MKKWGIAGKKYNKLIRWLDESNTCKLRKEGNAGKELSKFIEVWGEMLPESYEYE